MPNTIISQVQIPGFPYLQFNVSQSQSLDRDPVMPFAYIIINIVILGLSPPHGPVPALPNYLLYLQKAICHPLTPLHITKPATISLLIIPHLLARPSHSVPYPRASFEMRRILQCPPIAYEPGLLCFPDLPISQSH